MTLNITSVGYSRLVSLGNYENEKVSVSAAVDDGQDAGDVLIQLKNWTLERVTDIHANREDEDRAWTLRRDLADLEYKLGETRKQWNTVKEILAKHGVEIPSEDLEALPF